MTTETKVEDLPAGMNFDPVRGLMVRGMVARNLAEHPVIRRPNRDFATCTFDHLSNNTMLAMHLARIEPGGFKCNHRHFDETVAFIVTGSGWGDFRQADEADLIRVDWAEGDLVVIPCNSFHRHTNASDRDYARQLSFRTSRLMNAIVHGTTKEYNQNEALYNQGARFFDRFADEPDYFLTREEVAPGLIKTNYIRQVVDEPLPGADPDWGTGVAMQHYWMGGQRLLDLILIGIRAHGNVRAHRSVSEEGFVVLAGSGRTDIWDEDGHTATIEWAEGDLVSSPLGAWRRHYANGSEVRLLMARNVVIERALGQKIGTIGHFEALPVRFPDPSGI